MVKTQNALNMELTNTSTAGLVMKLEPLAGQLNISNNKLNFNPFVKY